MQNPRPAFPRLASSRLFVAAVAASLSACAAQAPTNTGFISAGPALTAPAATKDRLVHVAADFDAAAYDGWLLREVAIVRGPFTEESTDPAAREALLDHARQTIARAFDAKLPRHSAAGPRTLVVRAAITGIERANPVLNAVTTAAILTPVTAGGASSEIEVLDGATGKRLIAHAGADNGSLSLGFPQAYFEKYGHARRALARQADDVAALAATRSVAAK